MELDEKVINDILLPFQEELIKIIKQSDSNVVEFNKVMEKLTNSEYDQSEIINPLISDYIKNLKESLTIYNAFVDNLKKLSSNIMTRIEIENVISEASDEIFKQIDPKA